MKDKDLLLYGGVAIAAYFLFLKPKAAATVPAASSTVAPKLPVATSTLPANNTSSLVSQGTNLLSTILKTFSPPTQRVDVSDTPTTTVTDSLQSILPSSSLGIQNPNLFSSSGFPYNNLSSSAITLPQYAQFLNNTGSGASDLFAGSTDSFSNIFDNGSDAIDSFDFSSLAGLQKDAICG